MTITIELTMNEVEVVKASLADTIHMSEHCVNLYNNDDSKKESLIDIVRDAQDVLKKIEKTTSRS